MVLAPLADNYQRFISLPTLAIRSTCNATSALSRLKVNITWLYESQGHDFSFLIYVDYIINR